MIVRPPFAQKGCRRCGGGGFTPGEDGDWSCLACGETYTEPRIKRREWTSLESDSMPNGAGRDPAKRYWQKPKKAGVCSVCGEWHRRVLLAVPPGGGALTQVCPECEEKWAAERDGDIEDETAAQ